MNVADSVMGLLPPLKENKSALELTTNKQNALN